MKTIVRVVGVLVSKIRREFAIAELESLFKNLRIERPCIVRIDDLNAITVGMNVHIGAFSEIVILKNSKFSTKYGHLSIGSSVTIGCKANIRSAGGCIVLGDNCLIAQNVSIIAANHGIGGETYYRDAPWDENRIGVTIANNVWIGANATILPGVHIGENSIVAAGAVVNTHIPANQIWGGIPARFIKVV